MHSEMKDLLYEAEEHYLKPEEMEAFRHSASSLAHRVAAYELLREQEIAIFQPIANQLVKDFPQEKEKIERALKHWLSISRYCAMAMLLNNPEFLQRRLLEWLTDLIQTHQIQAIELSVYESLQVHLKKHLSHQQLTLLQPFLAQAKDTLLGTDNLIQLQR